MEVLRCVGGLADDHVLACGELQEALYARGGVFGALPVVAVGEEHDDCGEQAPFGFAGCDELIDDALCAVDEVAELGFPEDKSFGVVAGVAVLEAESCGFGEERVVNFESALGGGHVSERREANFGLCVDEDGVALVEGAALGVLSGEANGGTVDEKRSVGEEFGGAVVEEAFAFGHLDALLVELLHFGMDVEAGGIAVGEAREFEDTVGGDAGGDVLVGFADFTTAIVVPVVGEFGENGFVLDLGGGGLFGEEFFLDGLRFRGGIDADGFGVELIEGARCLMAA